MSSDDMWFETADRERVNLTDAAGVGAEVGDELGDAPVVRAMKTDFVHDDLVVSPPSFSGSLPEPPASGGDRVQSIADEPDFASVSSLSLLASYGAKHTPTPSPTVSLMTASSVSPADGAGEGVEGQGQDDTDAGRRSLNHIPPSLPQGPFFLRWSHLHVFASPTVVVDGLNNHFSATATAVTYDPSVFKFAVTTMLRDDSRGSGGKRGLLKQRSLRASRSASDIHTVQFAVQVYVADRPSSHHIVEFHSASRCPPRVFRASFDGCLLALRDTPGVAKVLPPGAATTNAVPTLGPLPSYPPLTPPPSRATTAPSTPAVSSPMQTPVSTPVAKPSPPARSPERVALPC